MTSSSGPKRERCRVSFKILRVTRLETGARKENSYFTRFASRFNVVKRLLHEYSIPGGKMLDVGCGDGITTMLMTKDIPMDIYGIEVDKESAKVADNFFACRLCDAGRERFPYSDCSFDVVHAGEVIEHIEDTDFCVSECWRVLKEGGVLIISTPNLASWVNRILLLVGYQLFDVEVSKHECLGLPRSSKRKWKPVGHIRCFTLRALKELLVLHGFAILEVKGTSSNIPILLTKIPDKVCNRFLPSFSRTIIVVAQKTHFNSRKTDGSIVQTQ